MQNFELLKYPRTPHLEGSRIQAGDEDMKRMPFSSLAGRHVVLEEKIDGANSAVSFDADGNLLLQSRGHYLTGGYRERHYNFMKQWASARKRELYETLGSRYIMYGEWMYAKHAIYYDALPHYFIEFDIYDRERGCFLDTEGRRRVKDGLPVPSVRVLAESEFADAGNISALIGRSGYITEGASENLKARAHQKGLDADKAFRETDLSGIMEGIYIKIEEDGIVKDRMKYVRASFLQSVEESGTHWIDRPIIENGLVCSLEDLLWK